MNGLLVSRLYMYYLQVVVRRTCERIGEPAPWREWDPGLRSLFSNIFLPIPLLSVRCVNLWIPGTDMIFPRTFSPKPSNRYLPSVLISLSDLLWTKQKALEISEQGYVRSSIPKFDEGQPHLTELAHFHTDKNLKGDNIKFSKTNVLWDMSTYLDILISIASSFCKWTHSCFHLSYVMLVFILNFCCI